MLTSNRPTFHGTGGNLLVIMLTNLLLTMITIGIYSFWGRTRVRSFFWSETEFAGDRFAYHGTGGELLIGYLKAIGIMISMLLLVGLLSWVVLPTDVGVIAAPVLFWGAILAIVPLAVVGSRRYRLSRTSWRNIRFSFRGRAGDFVRIFLPGVILTMVTLGVYTPFFHNNIRRFFTNHAQFGTERFSFDGEGADLFPQFLIALLLTIPTLGLYWVWYKAAQHRYYWSHTSFAGARFRSTLTGGGLLGLWLVTFVLVLLTLGIGTPWALVYQRRFMYDHLWLDGDVDFAKIEQDARDASATGDALSEIFDDGGFDLGL